MKTLSVIAAILTVLNFSDAIAAETTRYPGGGDGPPEAIRVQRGGLIHTRMLLGRDDGSGDFGFADLTRQLTELAQSCGGELADVVKLNVYVAEIEAIGAVRDGMRKAWPEKSLPAVTIVPTRIHDPAVQIAADAVIAVDDDGDRTKRFGNDGVLLPHNRDILYVSGRAASGELAEATAGTMQQLFDVLIHLGSTPADVVQVKAFLKPMSDWQSAAREIERSFGNDSVPPVVYVEWTSQSRATEIELIAAAPARAETAETITYFTPPADRASPVFSRVARVHGDEVIYISGLTGPSADSPENEVRSLFGELQRVAGAAGSDLRHLAKATYYVSSDEPSAALNQLRPEYYDPQRPPAASKIAVRSIGVEDRGLLIDMVAVPAATPGRP